MNQDQYKAARRLLRDNGRYALRWIVASQRPIAERLIDIAESKDPLLERAQIIACCQTDNLHCTPKHTAPRDSLRVLSRFTLSSVVRQVNPFEGIPECLVFELRIVIARLLAATTEAGARHHNYGYLGGLINTAKILNVIDTDQWLRLCALKHATYAQACRKVGAQ